MLDLELPQSRRAESAVPAPQVPVVRLTGEATAVPTHVLHQGDVVRRVRALSCGTMRRGC